MSTLATVWRSLVIRAGIGAVLLGAALALSVIRGDRAGANSLQYVVLPGLEYSGLFQFGAHYDEGTGDNGMLARDFNYAGDGSHSIVDFRATIATAQTPALWFVATHHGNCGVRVQAGWWDPQLQWHSYAGQVFHYIHVGNRIANLTWMGNLSALGASVDQQIGTYPSVPPVHTTCTSLGMFHLLLPCTA